MTAPVVPPIQIPRDDKDPDEVLNLYLKDKKYPTASNRQKVMQALKRRKADAIMACNYAEAEKLVEAENDIRAHFREERETEFTVREVNPRHSSKGTLKGRQSQLDSDYDKKIREVEQSKEDRLQELKKKHEMEKQKFAEHWKDSKTLWEFSKPSGQLRQLRDIEHKMALQNRFREAARIKKQADDLEKQETAAAQARAENAMKTAALKLLEKQKREIQKLDDSVAQKIASIETERRSRRRPIDMAIERVANEEKVTRGSATARGSGGTTTYREFMFGKKSALGAEQELGTPRTYRKHLELRKPVTVRQLAIREVETDMMFTERKRKQGKRSQSVSK